MTFWSRQHHLAPLTKKRLLGASCDQSLDTSNLGNNMLSHLEVGRKKSGGLLEALCGFEQNQKKNRVAANKLYLLKAICQSVTVEGQREVCIMFSQRENLFLNKYEFNYVLKCLLPSSCLSAK